MDPRDSTYPKCFHTGEVDFADDDGGKGEAMMVALMGWDACKKGIKPPPQFGIAMAKLSVFVDCMATPDGFSAKCKEWLAAHEDKADIEAANEALAEPGENITIEQLRKDLEDDNEPE